MSLSCANPDLVKRGMTSRASVTSLGGREAAMGSMAMRKEPCSAPELDTSERQCPAKGYSALCCSSHRGFGGTGIASSVRHPRESCFGRGLI